MKDVLGKEVKEGDKVILLVQGYYYGYKKAYLAKTTFRGKGPYGYEFGNPKSPYRVKNPEMVKIK